MAKLKIPKTTGAKIDLALQLRDERLALEKKVKELKQSEAVVRELTIEQLRKSKLDSASGKTATFSYWNEVIGVVENWENLYKQIKRKNAFDLLERRLSQSAYRDRLEGKEKIAGVKQDSVIKTSLTRLSG